jgi:hypothetical protein
LFEGIAYFVDDGAQKNFNLTKNKSPQNHNLTFSIYKENFSPMVFRTFEARTRFVDHRSFFAKMDKFDSIGLTYHHHPLLKKAILEQYHPIRFDETSYSRVGCIASYTSREWGSI